MPDGLDWIQWLIVGAILLGGLVRTIIQVVRSGELSRPGGVPPVEDPDEQPERPERPSVWETVEREREARAAATERAAAVPRPDRSESEGRRNVVWNRADDESPEYGNFGQSRAGATARRDPPPPPHLARRSTARAKPPPPGRRTQRPSRSATPAEDPAKLREMDLGERLEASLRGFEKRIDEAQAALAGGSSAPASEKAPKKATPAARDAEPEAAVSAEAASLVRTRGDRRMPIAGLTLRQAMIARVVFGPPKALERRGATRTPLDG